MNDMFTFEPTALELLLASLKPGSVLSALRLLQAAEREDDSALEEAFEQLAQMGVTVDISMLPADYGCGETENRLRMEEKLPADLLQNLDENDPLALYLQELALIPAQGDQTLLAQQLLQGDESAAEKLVDLNLSTVVEEARAHTARGVLLLDLIQEGSLGLWQGVLHYTGGDIDAHVLWWIRQAMARTVILQARQSGVLHTAGDAMEQYRQAERSLLTRLGRTATNEEIALEMGVTPEQAEMVGDMLRAAQELDRVKNPPKSDETEEERAVEDTAYFQSRQRVAEMLSALSQQETRVLTLRFGLAGGKPESHAAVGEKLGLTADEVVAVEAAALAKLRDKGE